MSNKWMLKLDSEVYSWLQRATIIGGFVTRWPFRLPSHCVYLWSLIGEPWSFVLHLYPRVPPIIANEDNKLSREIKK